MSLIRTVAVASLLSVTLLHPAFAGETLDRVMRKKIMVEVTDQSYPPFSSLDDKGEIVGFDIDVAKEIGKRLGVEVKVETPSFEIITAGNWKSRYDICVCSMSLTEERKQVLEYVAEYYKSPAVIVTSGDNMAIKSAADLNGKRVGVQASTTYEKYINKTLNIPGGEKVDFPFESAQVKPYESEVSAFQDLGLGGGKRLDAVIANYLSAKEYVEKSDGKFKIVGEPVFTEPVWIAVDKGDPEWVAKVKETVSAMSKDGTLGKISEKWLGADLTPKS